MIRRCLAEALGTFALVFAGTGAIVIDEVSRGAVTHVGVALTFGLVVMTAIFALGGVSGAHLNAAVTIGFWAAGRFPRRDVLPYLLSQLLGALVASLTLRLLFGSSNSLGATIPNGPVFRSFVLELILTAALMFVIMAVSCRASETGLTAGIAVGGVVALEALFAGPICGASMNPARSIAPALVSGHLQYLWVYIIAPIAGALIGVVLYRLTEPAGGHEVA